MPENQDIVVARRRTRRPVAESATGLTDGMLTPSSVQTTSGPALASNADVPPAATPPIARAVRGRRSSASATTSGDGSHALPQAASSSTPVDAQFAAARSDTAAAAPSVTAPDVAPRRRGRPRKSEQTSVPAQMAGGDAAPTEAPAAMPATTVQDAKPVRARRAARSADTTVETAPTQQALVLPVASNGAAEPAALHESSRASEQTIAPVMTGYRFARRAHANQHAEAAIDVSRTSSEAVAPRAEAEPLDQPRSAQPSGAPSPTDERGGDEQNGRAEGASGRELRLPRERIIPGVPGGMDYYRGRSPVQRQDRSGAAGRGQTGAPGVPGSAGSSGRPSGPYTPGGRGQTPPPPQAPAAGGQGYDTPGYGAQQGGNGLPAQSPYSGYTPYDPYTGAYNGANGGAPNGAGQERPPTGRPVRGRTYPSQAPYPAAGPGQYNEQRLPRTPRGPTPTRQGQHIPDPYRERDTREQYRDPYAPQGPQSGRAAPSNRTPYGVTDRRGPGNAGGATGGRMPYSPRTGREPRETPPGYAGSLYTNVPGSTAPHAPAETRYPDGRYTGTNRAAGPAVPVRTVEVSGLLWLGGGLGMNGVAEVLDGRTLQSVARLNLEDVRRLGLRSGDEIRGMAEERNGRRIVVAFDSINDMRPEDVHERPSFEQLTASFPDRRIHLEQEAQPISLRIIDLFAPLGFGSRALIVAPPKTGKTTLIREAAEAVLTGYPEAVVMAVLVGERPEEVTDLRSRLEPRGGLVYAASFDEDTQRHAWLVQVAVERAKRVAESGRDAFMVLDSLTRLARAENLATRGQGRTLSGGIDAQALDTGRRAFGAARNLEEGGSITILATCLVDTGSRQDDVVYEEFKGTGNMELHLSRDLSQRRLFPALDAVKSGTRREEMLLTPDELRAATALRRRLADLPAAQATQQLLSVMEKTPSNSALLQAIEQSGWTGSTR